MNLGFLTRPKHACWGRLENKLQELYSTRLHGNVHSNNLISTTSKVLGLLEHRQIAKTHPNPKPFKKQAS